MAESVVRPAVRIAPTGVRQRLEEAACLAKAAEACGLSGRAERGVELANDVDDLVKDAEGLLAGAAVFSRLIERRDEEQASGTPAKAASAADAAPLLERRFVQAALKTFLSQARHRLDQALGIARAAEVCLDIIDSADGVRVALAIEPLLYETKHFINTATIINRLSEE